MEGGLKAQELVSGFIDIWGPVQAEFLEVIAGEELQNFALLFVAKCLDNEFYLFGAGSKLVEEFSFEGRGEGRLEDTDD